MANRRFRFGLRLQIILFLLSAIAILIAFTTLSSFSSTLNRLESVEAERDGWQRPSDVIQALDVGAGQTVVDLGSGAGYFTLKLADVVGANGAVVAVDLRRLSLLFLRVRALLRRDHNIKIIVGSTDNPRLSDGVADAVLVSNTYHEFVDPQRMLEHVFRALRPGGRLVIVDREPREMKNEPTSGAAADHERAVASVEDEVRHAGFWIVRCDHPFIDRPSDEPWWLLVARRP